jgi:uncharacterized protein with HEPN domain
MPHKTNRDILKVKDVLRAIELIFSFTEKENFEIFLKSDLLQSAVIRQFEIIGEAGSKVSEPTQNTFNNIPWRSIKSFRNLLLHEYFKVDAAEVWTTIQHDLPEMKEQMELVLSYLQKK